MALVKPKVMSVPQVSLSMVLGDDVQALLRQAVGGLGGAVAAQHEQAVELELVVGVDHRGNLLNAVLARDVEQLEGRAAGTQDGAAAGEDAGEVGGCHHAELAVDETAVAVLKAVDLHGLLALVYECLHDAAHGGIERLAVAAAREQADSKHRMTSLVVPIALTV